MRSWIVTLLVLVLFAPRAGADCMAARSFISPATGSTVPADPVLFAFVAWDRPMPGVKVTAGGQEVKAEITHLSSNPTFGSYRIEVDRDEPGDIEVVVSLEVEGSEAVYAQAVYTVDPAWKKASKAGEVQAKMLGKEVNAWTCSHNMTYNLEPSVKAPAYRVEWSATMEDWEAGKRVSAVFPYTLKGFFDPEFGHAEAVIKLGHANCLSDTFEWPDALVYVGLAALHEDGSETPAAGTPTEVPWSFGQASWGAMTDEFYEEVHGTDEHGNPVPEGETEAGKPSPSPAQGAQDETSHPSPPESEEPPAEEGKRGGCSITGPGMPGPPAWAALAAILLVVLGHLTRTTRHGRT